MRAEHLSTQGLGFAYQGREVFRDLTLQIARGEFLAIVGPSGCGKTTLLKLLAGDLAPTRGSVLGQGRTHRVHQQSGLLPWLTVSENIDLGARGVAPELLRDRAELIRVLRLEQHLASYPYELSGGLRQRAELARALYGNPERLFLDEPFSSLDYLTRLETRDFLSQVLVGKESTVVMVTHDVPEALHLADRVIVLGGAPAEICTIIERPEVTPALVDEVHRWLR